ncbi:MAG TPA: hypothetical protein VH092_32630 [Urbifossiella sp.]|jgi:hypothetical protein|nr:hypothetical protein [Urbifossiella sp.]
MAKQKPDADKTPPGDPPAPPAGTYPRVCDPGDRAAQHPGQGRFKLRAVNHTGKRTLYVLAADETAARACYLAAEGLADPPADAAPVKLHVTALPD